MQDSDLDRELRRHFGKRAGSPLHHALAEYLDGGAAMGTLREIAFKHGVRESTLRMSLKSFRGKMRAYGVGGAGSNA